MSPTQLRALDKLIMSRKKYCSAYELQESLNTLESLARKDYIDSDGMKLIVKRKAGLGSTAFPASNIQFKIFRKKIKKD